jgi:hypothetical protein
LDSKAQIFIHMRFLSVSHVSTSIPTGGVWLPRGSDPDPT